MCWIALSPSTKKLHPHRHHHHHPHLHHHGEHHEHGSSVEELVRISRPSIRIVEPEHYHRHLYHPLHHHPSTIRLHGPGKKRAPHPPPPPPSRCSSRSREPIYRTQIIEPRTEIRETTRVALREPATNRARLRRVAGYEVLSSRVPWSWDCVSSVAGGSAVGRGHGNEKGGLRYPPFGAVDRWM